MTALDEAAPVVIEAPRTRQRRRSASRSKTNFEMYAWIFMRMSGLLLFVLVIGHLTIMLVLDGGVQKINFGFVAGRFQHRLRGHARHDDHAIVIGDHHVPRRHQLPGADDRHIDLTECVFHRALCRDGP